jgi:hypothetical protein
MQSSCLNRIPYPAGGKNFSKEDIEKYDLANNKMEHHKYDRVEENIILADGKQKFD